uniref:HSac2 domain-containing protein n=1 Tax=Leptobrachium leishanense TaxID=445787 RepID=A0A8C5PFX5_9ANUR
MDTKRQIVTKESQCFTMEREQTTQPETSSDKEKPQLEAHPMYTQGPRETFTPEYIIPETQTRTPREDFFIFRRSLVYQAIQDIQSRLSPEEDGNLQSTWILTQISHWGTECELLALLCDRTLMLCYYDFVGLCSSRLFRVPFNYIDTVTWGPLSYPQTALNKRDGQGLKVQWDKLREPPSLLSRWNPWAKDLPYIILTKHPGSPGQSDLEDMCKLEEFKERLVEAVGLAHQDNPIPGRANGLLTLQKPVNVETSVGLVSLVNSKTQLGYAKPRWNFGF